MPKKTLAHLTEVLQANLPDQDHTPPPPSRKKAGRPEVPVDAEQLARFVSAGGMPLVYARRLGVHQNVIYRRVDMMRRVVFRYLVGTGLKDEDDANEFANGPVTQVARIWLTIERELRDKLEDYRLKDCRDFFDPGAPWGRPTEK